jgi:hypothetical protein
MSGRVDFHVHSNKSSDGDFSPAELVGFAKDLDMRAISIADHDTVAAYPEAVELGRKAGVEVISGIELTTLFGGREFHLLLPLVDWTSPALARIIDGQTECRKGPGPRLHPDHGPGPREIQRRAPARGQDRPDPP